MSIAMHTTEIIVMAGQLQESIGQIVGLSGGIVELSGGIVEAVIIHRHFVRWRCVHIILSSLNQRCDNIRSK